VAIISDRLIGVGAVAGAGADIAAPDEGPRSSSDGGGGGGGGGQLPAAAALGDGADRLMVRAVVLDRWGPDRDREASGD
jgi:hypothetical protein